MHSLRTLPLLRPSRSASPNPNGTHEARSSTPAPPATTSTTALGTATPLTANSSAGLGKISNSTSGNVGLKPAPGRASEEEKVGRSVSMGGQPRGRSTGAGRLVMGLGGLNLSSGSGGTAPPGTNGQVELAPSPTPTLNGGGSTNGHIHPPTPLLRGNTTQISPPGSRAGTPLPPSTPLLGGQDGASIDAIGLRLNELVNKATVGVDLKAGRGMKKGLGWGLGEAVIKELPAPSADAYLIRAVLRASVKSLTIYGSRLEYFLLPAFTSTEFQAPVNLRPAPTPALAPPVLNTNQAFALSICHAAWETCEVLEVALETTAYPKFVVDTLRPIMDKFDSIVARVVMPLMGSIKKDLISSFSAEGSSSPPGHNKSLPAANGVTLPASLPAKAVSHIPGGLRTFASKVDAARRAFDLICKDCREDGETWVASVVVAVVWKGLCVCTARYDPDQKHGGTGRPPSPEAIHRALASLAKDGVGPQPTVAPTSTVGGAVGKMAGAMLPSRSVSRPPSPPRGAIRMEPLGGAASGSALPSSVVALASFEALVQRLVVGLVQKPATIAPAADDPTASEHLAREALDEALEAISSMKIILVALEKGHSYFCNVEKHLIDDVEMPDEKDERVVDAIEDAPAVLLFALLAKKVNKSLTTLPTTAWALRIRTPAAVFGITEEEYERQYLGAFGVAEERAKRVALAYKAEVERLSKEVAGLSGPTIEEERVREVKGWVKALAMGIEAMTGVVPSLVGH